MSPDTLTTAAFDADASVAYIAMRSSQPLSAPGRPGILSRAFRRDAPPPEADPLRERVLALVGLQRADGSWELGDQLASILDRAPDEIVAGLPAPLAPLPEARRAWATALALAWLETRAAAMADEWQWIAAKGKAWLEAFADGLAATGRGEASCGRDFRDAAREQLSRW